MKIVARENKINGIFRLDKLTLKRKNSDKLFEREQFIIPNSVGILVHSVKNNKIVLVRQFRIGPEMELEEIVAGKLEEKDESKESAASREVLEETGFQVESIELIHEFYTCPGPVTEKMNLYYAQVSNQVEAGGGLETENEEITIIQRNVSDFLSYTFIDAKTIIAQQWLKLHFPKE